MLTFKHLTELCLQNSHLYPVSLKRLLQWVCDSYKFIVVKSKVTNFPKRSGQLPFLLAYYFDPWMRVNTKRFKNESLKQITSLDIWTVLNKRLLRLWWSAYLCELQNYGEKSWYKTPTV